jgi:LCP family protein required for cell wall assembly
MRNSKRKSKKNLWVKIILGLLIVIAVVAGVVFATMNKTINKMEKVDIDKSDLNINEEEIKSYENAGSIKNIALLGIDAVEGETGRSDSIMIATIDTIHKKVKLTSIMRDSYVNIPDYGMDKINHAYAYGGAQLSMKTINNNFGLNVENFAAVNFSSLPEIIDILGGVELNITDEELQYINKYIDGINNLEGTNSPHITSSGVQTVDGVQALAYSRIRYTSGGDYVRTERHRNVISGLFNKLLSLPKTSYLGVLNKILPFIQTNMTSSEIFALGTNSLGVMGNIKLEQERFPLDGYSEGTYINNIYYLSFDIETTKKFFMDYIFDDKKEW